MTGQQDQAAGVLRALYHGLLGRHPDPGGAGTYGPWLRQDLVEGIQNVSRCMADSEEFAARYRHRRGEIGDWTYASHHGVDLALPPESEMLAELASPGGYEAWVLPYFLESLRPGMTVLDCGAALGSFALPAARLVGPGGRVVAVEVASRNGLALQAAARRNGFGNLEVLPLAAWDQVAALAISDTLVGHNYRVQPSPGGGPEAGAVRLVPALPLDLLAAQIGRVHVMKLDIEGAEYRALLGARRLIQASRPLIFAEYFPDLLQSVSGVPGAALLRLLLAEGYRVEILHRDAPRQLLAGLAPAQVVAAVDEAHAAWRARMGGTHLDLCFHPLHELQAAGGEPI